MNSRLKTVDIITVQGIAVVTVSYRQEKIPDRIQHVHFKFIILGGIRIRVNEDLEIVILENDIISFGYRTL